MLRDARQSRSDGRSTSGAVDEFGPTKACIRPEPRDAGEEEDISPDATVRIARIDAPAIDDVWITVARGRERSALCRARSRHP